MESNRVLWEENIKTFSVNHLDDFKVTPKPQHELQIAPVDGKIHMFKESSILGSKNNYLCVEDKYTKTVVRNVPLKRNV